MHTYGIFNGYGKEGAQGNIFYDMCKSFLIVNTLRLHASTYHQARLAPYHHTMPKLGLENEMGVQQWGSRGWIWDIFPTAVVHIQR